MEEGLLSIIIPGYNAEKYVERNIRSVLNQTYKNFELIFIDDGSKDKTYQIVEKLANEDKRIKLSRHENKGVCATRNDGLKIASGEYITFLYDDDYIEPNMYEVLINLLKTTNTDVACGITSRPCDDMGYISGGLLSKSKTVVPTTYCISGYNYLNKDNREKVIEDYFSEFSINRQTKEHLIESYMNSKDARSVLPRIDVYHFVEEIDNLNYHQIAKEIKDNIHYEVDANYINYLEEQKQEFCKLIDEKCKLGYFDKKSHRQSDKEQEF